MRALLLDTPGPIESGPVRMGELPDPHPAPGQLVIEVTACGVCRSNLHMIEGDWISYGVPAFTPIVPGHEVVGRVIELGDGVDWLHLGDRVGVQPLWSTCGHCEYCLTGRDQLCRSKQITGETVHGGYAERMLATAAHAHLVPDGLDDAEAAPLFCPGITAYNAVSKASPGPGSTLALFGVGGVGHMVLQFAGLTGAEVYAVARSAEHLALADELGAHPVDAARDPVGALTSAGGVDTAVVFAPSDEMLHQAMASVRPGGTVVLGVHARVGHLSFETEQRLVGSVIGSRQQMREVLALAAAGKVRARVERFPLDQAVDALERLKAGAVRARAVLLPGAR
ncbi:MAG: alcohol dehydrogenase catalytic domain-containing protein [Actinomycetota bacterium]|nr:alcohol dehydrogenase catalytic domain-containing protein [Actinomycetota bacterium]